MMRTIKLTLTLLGTMALVSAAANAASVSLSTDKSTYSPGETITLTVTTDSETSSFTDVFVQALFDSALVSATGTQSQVAGPGYFTGSLSTPDIGDWETMLNQFAFAPADPGTAITGTAQFLANNFGTAVFTTGSGQAGQPFAFGTAAAGAQASVTIVPEPTTVALLGMGLLGLGVAGRRR